MNVWSGALHQVAHRRAQAMAHCDLIPAELDPAEELSPEIWRSYVELAYQEMLDERGKELNKLRSELIKLAQMVRAHERAMLETYALSYLSDTEIESLARVGDAANEIVDGFAKNDPDLLAAVSAEVTS